MELLNNEVPGNQVWAVVSAHYEDSPRVVDWFITAEGSREDYQELVTWITKRQGIAERWQVDLPRRRMERADVTLFVEEQVLGAAPTHARKLEAFSQLPREE